jgi:hypothetical protein
VSARGGYGCKFTLCSHGLSVLAQTSTLASLLLMVGVQQVPCHCWVPRRWPSVLLAHVTRRLLGACHWDLERELEAGRRSCMSSTRPTGSPSHSCTCLLPLRVHLPPSVSRSGLDRSSLRRRCYRSRARTLARASATRPLLVRPASSWAWTPPPARPQSLTRLCTPLSHLRSARAALTCPRARTLPSRRPRARVPPSSGHERAPRPQAPTSACHAL